MNASLQDPQKSQAQDFEHRIRRLELKMQVLEDLVSQLAPAEPHDIPYKDGYL